ncbi:hypothetical protein GN956_G16411 [Arapaima gigas]
MLILERSKGAEEGLKRDDRRCGAAGCCRAQLQTQQVRSGRQSAAGPRSHFGIRCRNGRGCGFRSYAVSSEFARCPAGESVRGAPSDRSCR